MSIIEIAILALLAAAVFFALRRIVRLRKSGCSCGCASCGKACPMAGKRTQARGGQAGDS